jgi:hypothetical protein
MMTDKGKTLHQTENEFKLLMNAYINTPNNSTAQAALFYIEHISVNFYFFTASIL